MRSLKLYEGWDTDLGTKLNRSLSAKVFLGVAGLLILCCLVIYGSILLFLPKSYTVVASQRVTEGIQQLTDTLSQTTYGEIGTVIETFCQEYQATVTVGNGTDSQSYGQAASNAEEEAMSTVTEISFADQTGPFLLTVTAPVSPGGELTAAFGDLLPFLLLLILLIAGLGALLCSRVLVRPIQDLSQAARRLANLDMTWSCPLGRDDELGDLARSLHTMSRRLSAAMTSLEEANQVLQEDMARLTLLSQQRRDFFAAASHELKTPLTILKGQVESMVWGIGQYKNPQAILPETLRDVEHMEKLVKEILDISKLEMEGYPDTMESLSLPALVSRVGEELLPFAKAKDMTLHWNLAEPVTVTGNASLLEKAVHNLFSNAIRHAPSGASVWVTLSPQFLRVENSGVRIPEEDLPFLFTPFYRVEKSRNKATGGSGLGLYLVHAIATMHGFSCQIQNTDRGVAATLRFSPQPDRASCPANQK